MDFHHIMMLTHHNLYDSYKLYYCLPMWRLKGANYNVHSFVTFSQRWTPLLCRQTPKHQKKFQFAKTSRMKCFLDCYLLLAGVCKNMVGGVLVW